MGDDSKEEHQRNERGQDPILILGAGFLGSWYVRFLSQRLFANSHNLPLMIVDDGEFENRNLMAQYCYPRYLGSSKAERAGETATRFNLRVETAIRRFDAASDFDACLVVDCLDNVEGRFLAHQLAENKGVPIVHLSVSPHSFGMVEWNDKWSLNPMKQLAPIDFTQVEIDPCELIRYQEIGVKIAVRGAVVTGHWLATGETLSYHLTDMETTPL